MRMTFWVLAGLGVVLATAMALGPRGEGVLPGAAGVQMANATLPAPKFGPVGGVAQARADANEAPGADAAVTRPVALRLVPMPNGNSLLLISTFHRVPEKGAAAVRPAAKMADAATVDAAVAQVGGKLLKAPPVVTETGPRPMVDSNGVTGSWTVTTTAVLIRPALPA